MVNFPPPIPPIPPTYVSTNHVLHLILSLLTCGLWVLVWPCVHVVNTMGNSSKRKEYEEQLRNYQQQLWMHQQGGSTL